MPDHDDRALDRALLHELEPEAGRLLDRHRSTARDWFPQQERLAGSTIPRIIPAR